MNAAFSASLTTDAAQDSPDTPLQLRLIGQMQAFARGGESVLPVGRKTRALLAVVALSAPRPALRGRLSELLWSRRPEEQARASLRQEIHRLLEALQPAGGETLQVTRDHILLRPGAAWVDVAELMRATVDEPASLALLEGDLLEDLDGIDPTFDMWLTTERERLRDRARTLGELLLREQDGSEGSIPVAERLLQIDRVHEGAWRALMRAHAARGERGMAIQAYDRCCAVLKELMDAAPSLETQRLLNEIRGPSGSRVVLRPPAPAAIDEELPEVEAPPPGPARGGIHIGIVPLALVGADEQETRFAHGLVEEIGGALSQLRWLFVVSAASLARYAEGGRDEAAIRRIFGLDFLLDGTIQRVGEKTRVALRLLDLRQHGQVAWSGRFDREEDDLLSWQDEIAARVAAQVDADVLMLEARRAFALSPEDAPAYQVMLSALPLMQRFEKAPFMTAGELLRHAVNMAPDLAAAHAWLAHWHGFLIDQGWATDRAASQAEAIDFAERAVRCDPFDARSLSLAAVVYAEQLREPQEAASLHERAISLSPYLASAWARSAATQAYRGDIETAERQAARYKTLTPLHPWAFALDGVLCLIGLLRGDFERAVSAGRATAQLNLGWIGGLPPYLAALGHLGRAREAATVRGRLLAVHPGFSAAQWCATTPFEREQDRAVLAEGLRLAGLAD